MTERITRKISNLLKRSGACRDEDYAVVSYGIELIVTSFIGVICIIVLSVILGKPFSWMSFLLSFVPLRTTAGGYHAKTHLSCYLLSSAVFALSLVLAISAVWGLYVTLAGMSFSLIVIWFLAPIEAENKPLRADTYRSNKRRSRVIIVLEVVVVVIALLRGNGTICWQMQLYCAGCLTSSVSLVAAKIIFALRNRI